MTINCRGRLMDFQVPKVMGILNVTPDSFFDGGRYSAEAAVLQRAEQILNEGGDIIDIGGYSTRPGASDIPEDEELSRTVSAVHAVVSRFPDAIISVDTFRSSVAIASAQAGASVINDISGGSLDPQMLSSVARLQVPYIMMHMQGTTETMHQPFDYENVVLDVMKYFSSKIRQARELGINDLILDPGFGFSKSLEQNYQLMRELQYFKHTGLPMLVGISRKSMVTRLLGVPASEALNGTTALNMSALINGANILRVHDVKEAVECVRIFSSLGY